MKRKASNASSRSTRSTRSTKKKSKSVLPKSYFDQLQDYRITQQLKHYLSKLKKKGGKKRATKSRKRSRTSKRSKRKH